MEEKQCAYQFRLHTVLFNVDDYNAEGPIPGRYANISLRYLGHCSSGWFHWFRETGIIESDVIEVIMREVDPAVKFSRKANLLVDSAKRKYEDKCKTLGGDHGLEDMLMLDATASRTRGILKALPNYDSTEFSEWNQRLWTEYIGSNGKCWVRAAGSIQMQTNRSISSLLAAAEHLSAKLLNPLSTLKSAITKVWSLVIFARKLERFDLGTTLWTQSAI